MTKSTKIITSIIMIILGWFLNAFAWTTKAGPTISSISLLLGLGLLLLV